MLRQRVLTALALLVVLLPSLFSQSAAPFRLLSLVLISAAVWEWVRINGGSDRIAILTSALCAFTGLVGWFSGFLAFSVQFLWIVASVLWLVGAGLALRFGPSAWLKCPFSFRLILGCVGLLVAWLAVVQARTAGVNFLLSVMGLVWMADIGAYFAGRRWGGAFFRRKLAPTISPGKSWEGVLGGAVGVLCLAWVWMALEEAYRFEGSSVFLILSGYGPILFFIALLLMCGVSVLGDLFESLVKRAAGVKDSSGLLPGHGGVLDRIDALLPALPMAMLLSSFTQRWW